MLHTKVDGHHDKLATVVGRLFTARDGSRSKSTVRENIPDRSIIVFFKVQISTTDSVGQSEENLYAKNQLDPCSDFDIIPDYDGRTDRRSDTEPLRYHSVARVKRVRESCRVYVYRRVQWSISSVSVIRLQRLQRRLDADIRPSVPSHIHHRTAVAAAADHVSRLHAGLMTQRTRRTSAMNYERISYLHATTSSPLYGRVSCYS